MYVVEYHWHSVAWGFRKADISRDDALKDLRPEEAPQIGGDLLRERGAIIIHRKQNPLDREGWIDGAAKSRQRVQ